MRVALLERPRLGRGRLLQVHGEPEREEEQAADARRHVLRELAALLAREFPDRRGVGGDLRLDPRAAHARILHLRHGHGPGRTACAGDEAEAQRDEGGDLVQGGVLQPGWQLRDAVELTARTFPGS
jgi:hypothetical protein